MKLNQKILIATVICLTTFISCKKASTNTPSLPVDARDQYVGYWQMHDSNEYLHQVSSYILTISKSSTSDEFILMDNLYNQGTNGVIAKVNNDTLHIPLQLNDLSGFGTIMGANTITLTYSWFSDHYATGTKK